MPLYCEKNVAFFTSNTNFTSISAQCERVRYLHRYEFLQRTPIGEIHIYLIFPFHKLWLLVIDGGIKDEP